MLNIAKVFKSYQQYVKYVTKWANIIIFLENSYGHKYNDVLILDNKICLQIPTQS